MKRLSRLPLPELPITVSSRLLERVRVVTDRPIASSGKLVLYWLRTAMRAHENPALDLAIEFANQLALPLVVYQGLSEKYPYASDRQHRFVIEGMIDLASEMRERGIHYLPHIERGGHREPYLQKLAAQAAVVITEEMPVDPLRRWTSLASRHTTGPVYTVDTACVWPMPRMPQSYDRAFAFRDAAGDYYDKNLTLPWDEVQLTSRPTPELADIEPTPIFAQNIAEIIAACEIDHTLAAVAETRGGSVAGYERWNQFRQTGLRNYAARRNDPLHPTTSRMSAYLHYGMVSPLRIAREASAQGGAGAEKYLDELLVWRELAYNYCYFHRAIDRLSTLPRWAQETLAQHAGDRRPNIYSWEQLARGQTDDELWNLTQQSLLRHGELHNNLRMTWGKRLLDWTASPHDALAMAIDLNHRYALDGRDPASYGGLLWCFGLFDRPFHPEEPIRGRIRSRSTAEHAARLDLSAYAKLVGRPIFARTPRVAIIGAGPAGLMAARTLADHGISAEIFEKSRGLGGRVATRRTSEGLAFDHGAQYFTARDERVQRLAESWAEQGIIAPWTGRIVARKGNVQTDVSNSIARYVGQPTMNSFCKHLATGLTTHLEHTITAARRDGEAWWLDFAEHPTQGPFDWIIGSSPAGQAAKIFASGAPSLAAAAAKITMTPCWALLVAFDRPVEIDYDGAFINQGALTWIARSSSKPSRKAAPDCWVAHASSEYSLEHLEKSAEEVLPDLLKNFYELSGIRPQETCYAAAHRWRFAIPPQPTTERCLVDLASQAILCGDWCGGPRVEGALLSGMAAAGRLLGELANTPISTLQPKQRMLELS